jgi:oligoendopeptidase F
MQFPRSVARRALPAALLGLLLAGAPARAQEAFKPIPGDVAPLYHFNFPRNFFASPEKEKADRAGFFATLKELEGLKGKVAASPANLLRALQLYDRTQQRFMPHYIYLYLRYAVDTKNEASHEQQKQLGAEFDRHTAFLQQELMRIDAKTLARFTAQEPRLKVYHFAIEQSRRNRPHTLTLQEEELLGTTSPLLTGWQSELYQKALDRTQFGKVRSPQGELDVWKQTGEIDNSPDRPTREAGFKKRYAGYATHRDLYAFALTQLVKARNQVARLKHFPDSPSAAYFALYLETPQVKNLFDRLGQEAEFNKRYQRLRAERIRKIGGFQEANVWDRSVIPPGKERPRFDVARASKVIAESLAPLGEGYAGELAALLEPRNGRLDLVPGENRVPGAFAWGFPGGQTSIFYSFNYEGYYDDVSTLAHEAGHAVHFQLMGDNKVLPVYTDGPSYFFESFAMFNELVVADALYRAEQDPFRRTYFLERFLDQAMAVFPITRQAALEQAIYDGVQKGDLKTADDLDATAKRIGSRFSIWFDRHDELKMEWVDVHHYYTSPLYYVNYVFANFLALKYYEMYTRDPNAFVPRYVALMRNGFNAAPPTLLRKFVNVDLKDPKLVSDTFAILDGKIKSLEELYARDTP